MRESAPKEWLDFLREQYPAGSRIRLREMGADPCPVEPGTMGTLEYIDDAGTFGVTWDNGRTLGLVMGVDSFTVLPPPTQTLKLYMPLTADYYEPDEWGELPEEGCPLNGRELLAYEEEILASLLRERRRSEAERSLMHYYGKADGVDEKVLSYVFTAEEWEGRLWGVAECQVQGELTGEELETLLETVAGQASDGFGEVYEQRPLRVGDGELYVHLWQDTGWNIMTERERFDPTFPERLPEQCYSTLPSDGSLILLKRGESGYFQTAWSRDDPERNRRTADYLNQKRGVSKAQEEAMTFGSLFGWDKPGADPKVYLRQQEEGGITLG